MDVFVCMYNGQKVVESVSMFRHQREQIEGQNVATVAKDGMKAGHPSSRAQTRSNHCEKQEKRSVREKRKREREKESERDREQGWVGEVDVKATERAQRVGRRTDSTTTGRF